MFLYISTDKGMFMTIAVDLVIAGIQEPVRFVVETKVRIFPPTERFWYYISNKKPVQEMFYLVLEEVSYKHLLVMFKKLVSLALW